MVFQTKTRCVRFVMYGIIFTIPTTAIGHLQNASTAPKLRLNETWISYWKSRKKISRISTKSSIVAMKPQIWWFVLIIYQHWSLVYIERFWSEEPTTSEDGGNARQTRPCKCSARTVTEISLSYLRKLKSGLDL